MQQPAIGNKPKLPFPPGQMTYGPGLAWAICITPGPNQVLFSADAYPGRVYKLSLDGKLLGLLWRVRKATETIRMDP